MAYCVLEVCRHIINYSNEKKYEISNLKLQKLLYFAQGCFLIDKDKPCFNEKIEAWDFGPVVPEAYHEYKVYGATNIPPITHVFKFDKDNLFKSGYVEYKDNIITDEDKAELNEVVDSLSKLSAIDLVEYTHSQKPWKDAYIPGCNIEISNSAIKECFMQYEK